MTTEGVLDLKNCGFVLASIQCFALLGFPSESPPSARVLTRQYRVMVSFDGNIVIQDGTSVSLFASRRLFDRN